jgi:hypothetical protein
MKYPTARFKNMTEALKQLGPSIRDPRQLRTGRPQDKFYGLRPREILANWLLCAALNFPNQTEEVTFFSTRDPIGSDGVIYDTLAERTVPTEHVFVRRAHGADAPDAQNTDALILNEIAKKNSKGKKAYASGKTLMVFLDAGIGKWSPHIVASQLPEPLYFNDVWVVWPQCSSHEYIYGVTLLDLSDGSAPTWRVRILENFDEWEVGVVLAVIQLPAGD